jgi:Sugar (and other) transporter.
MLVSPVGCFLGGVILEKIGRRSGILLGQILYIVGWSLIAAADSAVMLICGRILDGIAVGIVASSAAVRR